MAYRGWCPRVKGAEYLLSPYRDKDGNPVPSRDAQDEARSYVDYVSDGDASDDLGQWVRVESYGEDEKAAVGHRGLYADLNKDVAFRGNILRNISDGKSLDGTSLLTKADAKGVFRQPTGYDMQFSVPKSLSILALTGDVATRQRFRDIVLKANAAVIERANREGMFFHRGRVDNERMNLVCGEVAVAAFVHESSRADDPQLHVHNFVARQAVSKDGKIVTLDNYRLKANGGYLQALFRAEIVAAVKADPTLSMTFERDKRNFAVAGVPQQIIDLFSKRRAAVEKAMKAEAAARGLAPSQLQTADNRALAEIATLSTRDEKSHRTTADLLPEWIEQMKAAGYSRELIDKLVTDAFEAERRDAEVTAEIDDIPFLRAQRETPTETTEQRRHRLMSSEILGELADKASLTQRELKKLTAEALQCEGMTAEEIATATDGMIEKGLLVRLTDDEASSNPNPRYTLQSIIDKEIDILRYVHDNKGKVAEIPFIKPENSMMSPEQEAAARRLLSTDRVSIVNGNAGAGKTTSMKPVVESATAAGYDVWGGSPSWAAAEILAKDTGIDRSKCLAVAKILVDYDAGKVRFDAKTLLLIDEAGMVDLDDMRRLIEISKATGARLALVGDFGQFQPVGVGSIFGAMHRVTEIANLETIFRQVGTNEEEKAWMRAASMNLAKAGQTKDLAVAAANVRAAIEAYDAAGCIRFGSDAEDTIAKAVDYYRSLVENHGDTSIDVVFATQRNHDARAISAAVRDVLIEKGILHDDAIEIRAIPRGKDAAPINLEIRTGDRLIFGESVEKDGTAIIRNNDRATVLGIDDFADGNPIFRLAMDKGTELEIAYRDLVGYRDDRDKGAIPPLPKVQHCYAATAHSLQGLTVDHAIPVFLHGSGKHSLYVNMTRHRKSCVAFIDEGRLAAESRLDKDAAAFVVKGGQLVDAPEEDAPTAFDNAEERMKALVSELKAADPSANATDWLDDVELWAKMDRKPPQTVPTPTTPEEAVVVEAEIGKSLAKQTAAFEPSKDSVARRNIDGVKKGFRERFRRVDDAEYHRFRYDINLAEFARSELNLKFIRNESGWFKFENGNEKIVVAQRPLGWLWTNQNGGSGDIVELTKHVLGCAFTEAVNRIRNYLGISSKETVPTASQPTNSPTIPTKPAPVTSAEAQAKLDTFFQQRIEHRKSFSSWLHKERGLEIGTIKKFGNAISADELTGINAHGAVFWHRDLDGKVVSAVRRGTERVVIEKNADGTADYKLRTFSNVFKDTSRALCMAGRVPWEGVAPDRIYIADSMIDSLSLYQYDHARKIDTRGALIVSPDGNPSHETRALISELAHRFPNAKWQIGIEHDKGAGEKFRDQIVALVKEGVEKARAEGQEVGGSYAVRDPDKDGNGHFKDWNDRIRGVTKDEAEASKAERAREKIAEYRAQHPDAPKPRAAKTAETTAQREAMEARRRREKQEQEQRPTLKPNI